MAKKPTKDVQEQYKKMVDFGCVVCKKHFGVFTEPCIHHFTGAGMGLKSVDKFIPLCHAHHQGQEGIHHIGKHTWEAKYGTQKELLDWYKLTNES